MIAGNGDGLHAAALANCTLEDDDDFAVAGVRCS